MSLFNGRNCDITFRKFRQRRDDQGWARPSRYRTNVVNLNLSNATRIRDENVQVDNTCCRYLRECIGRPGARVRRGRITHRDLMGTDKSSVFVPGRK